MSAMSRWRLTLITLLLSLIVAALAQKKNSKGGGAAEVKGDDAKVAAAKKDQSKGESEKKDKMAKAKVSPWEKLPNSPAFVGHLVVPYPTSNFISLTMKQAYVLYLWLQVRRLSELLKNKSANAAPDGELSLDDINTMVADFSKTGFMKLPMPYKPPLFLPTDSEASAGKRKEFADGTSSAKALEQNPTTPYPFTTPPITTTTKKPAPTKKSLQKTGSKVIPPSASPTSPHFPAYKSKVDAKKNPNLPVKFPAAFPPKPTYPIVTKDKSKNRSPSFRSFRSKPSSPPHPAPKSTTQQARPFNSADATPHQSKDRRRFFQRVANYMNKLGAQMEERPNPR